MKNALGNGFSGCVSHWKGEEGSGSGQAMQKHFASFEVLWDSVKRMTIGEAVQTVGLLLQRRNEWTMRDVLDLVFSLVAFLRAHLWKNNR